ncbi:MAG TPA: protein-glutamate O-methyltransferase CheR [Gaiellaceae bacterium]|jgi:chemotaxis protein methyltransferase CheR|nr:protein-glutamate O-methyltransferase CheR [Gaiellaceae bacterium]
MSVLLATRPHPGRDDDYVTFCEGVRRICGIDLLQYKRGQMERRIRTFASNRGVTDLGAYLRRLHGDRAELEAFLDRVTINVSQLWRNPQEWVSLARDVLPELAKAGRIRAWSAGSSYGAEAYTLAALMLDTVRGSAGEILGTDIDPRMVARAREGRFSAEDARSAPPEALTRWFEQDGGEFVARRELKALVRFETGDLLRMPFPEGRYDLVLCRNTVIYFTEDVRDALHERLARSIRPGGYLLIGSTERVSNTAAVGLEVVRPFLYRKVA